VEHEAGYDASIMAAIAGAARRSAVPGVRWRAGSLGTKHPESDIATYYNSCASGDWSVPQPED
jgi:hypothetical protein